MTRTKRDPKEFILMILNEHVKFLNRLKRRKIPDKYLPFIDEEKERTNQQIELVNNDFTIDYKQAIARLENENRKLENKIKKKDDIIQRKDNEIQRKDDLIQMKDNEIEDLHENLVSKDNQILILKEQMNNLQVEYAECVDENEILTNQLEIERAEKQKAVNEIFKLENQYINLYERLMSLINQDEGEDEGEDEDEDEDEDEGEDDGEDEGEDEGEGEENEGDEDKNKKDEDDRKWWRDRMETDGF
ncbi:hypothetical protein C2G38_2167877 [Gigaspora rosea]|uniref:Uncharacterized protein n=1 Tax=Gigaspora rosea TaxID=44941 RepID=A0A397VRZ1_9GLOM|nr:hypothetical protein C2G38_2167877 [Gigaspora rosea]